ncbi:hypothetical protein [Tumebacillus lipolyticus]|uniref:Uncharacterized protein n=1 Tax=Tumebacillus lipolyticus TaxID=1280370 RepID=A0ABW4ZSH7_9BACL
MKSTETRARMLDRYYRRHAGMVKKVRRYYLMKDEEELAVIRAELTRRQHMLGNIPLLASTTPIVFLIFGSQVNRYFPHDSLHWLIVAILSILVIVWSINHHFKQKGRVHLDLWLIEQILKDRFQNAYSAVQLGEVSFGGAAPPFDRKDGSK